jgi:hypothetical protein
MEVDEGTAGSGASPAQSTGATDVTANSSAADVIKDSSSQAQASVDGGAAGKNQTDSPEDYSKGLLEAITEAADPKDGGAKVDNTDGTGADGKAAKAAKPGATDTTDKTGAEAKKDPAAEGETESDDPADYADTPFGKHPRFQKILGERKQFRDEARQAQQELTQVKPQAEQYGKIDSFAKEFGISAQEMTESFRIMMLVKTDPTKAREVLAGHLARLDEVTGHKLPADLQKEVDDGVITEARARELSLARGKASIASKQTQQTQAQLNQERQDTQQREQAGKAVQVATARKSAVREVEKRLLAEDPDYPRLQKWVIRELQAEISSMRPEQKASQTPDQAVKLFNDCVDRVRKDLRNLMPRKPEIRPAANSAHGGANLSAQKKPETMLEAVLQAADA